MKFELKNVKVHPDMSEETTCFSASLYVDGKRCYIAQNNGHGGCNSYHPVPEKPESVKMADIGAWIDRNVPAEEYHGMTLKPDLDTVVGDLLEDFMARKDLKNALRKICVLEDGQLMQYKAKDEPRARQAFEKFIADGKVKGQLVNGNPELEEAALAAMRV